MENSQRQEQQQSCAGSAAENCSDNTDSSTAAAAAGNPPTPTAPRRIPFTRLSQVDADLALARALQEQERAYMMLSSGGGGGEDYEFANSEEGSFEVNEEHEEDFDDVEMNGEDSVAAEEQVNEENRNQENRDVDREGGSEFDEEDDEEEEEEENEEEDEDAFDANVDHNDHGSTDGVDYEDEAIATALQEAEDMAVGLMMLSGLCDYREREPEDSSRNSQAAWEEFDPDELSYEELIALGEVVGTESRGLSADTISSLPSISYKAQTTQDGNTDQCVICRLEYEGGDSLVVLSCKHTYHQECINRWLQINKVCPICNLEVSTSGTKLE